MKHIVTTLCIITSLLAVVAGGTQAYAVTPQIVLTSPTGGALTPNAASEVRIGIATNKVPLNAVEITLAFPHDLLRLDAVDTGRSGITLWVDRPTDRDIATANETGSIKISGAVPGTLVGEQVELATLVLTPRSEGTGELRVISAHAYRADGLGTPLALNTTALRLTSSAANVPTPTQRSDTTPPPPATVEITRSDDLFEGGWFASITTLDKESGTSYYEVAEFRGRVPAPYTRLRFERTDGVYRLHDQTRQSYLYVRTVDNRGNASVAVIEPTAATTTDTSTQTRRVLIAIIVVMLTAGAYVTVRRSRA